LPFASGWLAFVKNSGLSLADRLLAIGRDCAARLKEPFRSVDPGDLLYDERGLPR
jgi:antitoxin VapB